MLVLEEAVLLILPRPNGEILCNDVLPHLSCFLCWRGYEKLQTVQAAEAPTQCCNSSLLMFHFSSLYAETTWSCSVLFEYLKKLVFWAFGFPDLIVNVYCYKENRDLEHVRSHPKALVGKVMNLNSLLHNSTVILNS